MTMKKQDNILTEDILEQRVREYSRQEEKTETKGELKEFLGFRLRTEWYCIDMSFVDEIIKSTMISRLPRQKDFVLGAMNVRGNILLIIDPGILFQLPPRDTGENPMVISVKTAEVLTGLFVDEVSGVMTLDTGIPQAPISTIKGIEAEFIRGLFKYKEKHFIWLDIERVLSEAGNRLARTL